ncbi:MAG: hypothetical protein MJ107_07455 [Lachnospiraceae bacterium]|nr:hypothetical protein [Lachnospiraceae bacterium]
MAYEEQHSTPIWIDEIPEGEFVSYYPSYEAGKYFDLFEKKVFPNETVGDLTYYVYDPIKHGAAADGKYPVIFFYHGRGNSFVGELVINYSMAELYSSPEYQKSMGGAYLVTVVANEEQDENGRTTSSWNPDYCKPLIDLKKAFYKEHADNAGKSFFMGTSAGAYMVWTMLPEYYTEMDVIVPIAGSNIPDDETLEKVKEHGTEVFIIHGRHDELVPFDYSIGDREEHLKSLSNFTCYFPEWVHNADGGIAHLDYGAQMGQHCVNNQVQCNLIYDDGTPYDERWPEGMTGWIRDHA